jgi:hypothetical protein
MQTTYRLLKATVDHTKIYQGFGSLPVGGGPSCVGFCEEDGSSGKRRRDLADAIVPDPKRHWLSSIQ